MAVFRVALQMALGILLTFGLQLLLRAWTTEARRARGWNSATWGCALYAFGPGSMLGFCVTHGRLTVGGVVLSLLRGLVWAAILVGLLACIDAGFVGRYGTTAEKRDTLGIEAPARSPAPRAARRPPPSR